MLLDIGWFWSTKIYSFVLFKPFVKTARLNFATIPILLSTVIFLHVQLGQNPVRAMTRSIPRLDFACRQHSTQWRIIISSTGLDVSGVICVNGLNTAFSFLFLRHMHGVIDTRREVTAPDGNVGC